METLQSTFLPRLRSDTNDWKYSTCRYLLKINNYKDTAVIKFTNSFIISKICDKKKRKEKVRVPKVDTVYPLKWRHLNKIPVSALLKQV